MNIQKIFSCVTLSQTNQKYIITFYVVTNKFLNYYKVVIKMKKNVGSADKMIRIVLGVVIAALGIYFKSLWGLVAIVPLATAFMNSCPAYSLLGMSSDKKVKVEKLS